MPRPKALYVPHILSTDDIQPEERYAKISHNLSCYGINVLNNRRPQEIVAHHKTISGVMGDFCSAIGSSNETIYDPQKAKESSLYISLLIKGNQVIQGKDGKTETSMNTGTLIVHQRADYFHYKSDNVKQLYIIPNYSKVKEIFNGKFKDSTISLENHHLADFLKSHMLLLDSRSESLTVKETALIVDNMHNIALTMLSDIAHEQGLLYSGKHQVIFNNAVSFIKQNYSNPDLSPDKISVFLRCSRASLDRAFKEQHTSVMNIIKSVRLEAAKDMLSSQHQLRIEQISWHCGFMNHALFSKLFREKYNTSPKSWRDNFYNSHKK